MSGNAHSQSAIKAALRECAEALEVRLVEALDDDIPPSRVKFRVENDDIVGFTQVVDVDDIGPVETSLTSSLSVIANEWSSTRSGDSPRRKLECVIPPDVKPRSWQALANAPRTFALWLEATLPADEVGAASLLPIEVDEGPHTLVMKGGGIKGLAYVGALEELYQHYEFDHFVGTSAGAISALLLAARYSPAELKSILETKDFRDFFDAPWYMKPINLVFHRGLNHAHSFTDWIDDLLAKKLGSATRVRMSDLPCRATVFGSRRNKSALRFDSETDDADAGHAARCSMSIPLVFVPQSDQGFRTYDGGLQHNYPLDELLRDDPDKPFVSLYLGSETYKPARNRFEVWEWVGIWTEGGDAELLKRHQDRTVVIDTDPIQTLDFQLSDEEKKFLLACGKVGALAHLKNGGDQHQAAIKVRDGLRQEIDLVRARRKRRRWGRRILVLIALVLTPLAVWFVGRWIF